MNRKNPKVSRQPTEEDVKKSDNRHKDLADSLPQTVAEIDIAGNITFTNLASFSMFGYTKEDFDKGLNIFQMIAPEERERARENIEKFIKGQEHDGEEYIYTGVRKDGSRFPFTVYLTPVLRENKTVGFRIILIDVTERKRSEEALYAAQMQLSQAMDLAHIVYWETDPTDDVFLFNDAFYALYGTTAEQEGGYRITRQEFAKRFVHPDDLLLVSQFMEQNTQKPDDEFFADIEHRIIRRDGEVRNIIVRASIAKDASGRLIKRYGANQDITERRQMEKAVRESGEQFERLFKESPLGMVKVGADGLFIRANAAFCNMLGYTEHELTSRAFKDITHPDHIAEDVRRINDLIRGKIHIYRTEKRYIRKDKGIVWVSIVMNILRDKDDRFLYFLTTVENITQRKQLEKTLEESKARLDLALQSASMGVWRWDLIQDRRYFDNQVCSLLGIEPATFTGTANEFFNVVHPDDREMLRAALARTIEQDAPYEPEYRAVWPDGSVHYIAARGRLVRADASNRPESINGIIWDITKRKEAESALQESEARFRNTVEMLPEVVFETDLDINVTYVNRAGLDLFGYSAADFGSCCKSIEMLVREDGPVSAERLGRQLKGEKTGASEYTALRKDGSTFPILLHMKPMMKGGELVGFHGIMIDITGRVRSEDMKRHSEKLSTALEMAGTICHEFNQPLQVISGRVELLSMKYEGGPVQEIVKSIKEQVQSMGTITKKLMGLKTYSNRDYVGGIKITDIDQAGS